MARNQTFYEAKNRAVRAAHELNRKASERRMAEIVAAREARVQAAWDAAKRAAIAQVLGEEKAAELFDTPKAE